MEENKRRFRNHISIVAEQIGGGIIAVLALLLVNVIQEAGELAEEDLSAMADRGLLITAGERLLVGGGSGVHAACVGRNRPCDL